MGFRAVLKSKKRYSSLQAGRNKWLKRVDSRKLIFIVLILNRFGCLIEEEVKSLANYSLRVLVFSI